MSLDQCKTADDFLNYAVEQESIYGTMHWQDPARRVISSNFTYTFAMAGLVERGYSLIVADDIVSKAMHKNRD